MKLQRHQLEVIQNVIKSLDQARDSMYSAVKIIGNSEIYLLEAELNALYYKLRLYKYNNSEGE